MDFAWTPHRFSGGALALDVANSVILRFDPERSIDRFAMTAQMDDFVPAAITHCAERQQVNGLTAATTANVEDFLALREAIDDYFRARTLGNEDRHLLASMLALAARNLSAAASDTALEARTARSALALTCEPDPQRMKICGNCGWLFIDRSKNRSRTWCDMAVCGNRAKANRHYQRQKQGIAP